MTIQIKAVNVNKKIEIDEENLNFHKLEERIHSIVNKLGGRLLEDILHRLDDRIRESRPKKVLENKGRSGKYLSTGMVDIRYNRRRYYDKEAGGYRYLLDEALGFKKRQTVSISRRKLEARLAVTTGSYRKAKGELQATTGSSRSHEAIRGVVLKEGKRIREMQKRQLQREYNLEGSYKGEPNDVVYVEADGTRIHHQGSDGKKGKDLEVKVGICYTGKRRRYGGGSGKARIVDNKYIHLDIAPGPVFMRDLSLVAEREVGLSRAKHVMVGGDGASWIRKGMDMNFAGAHYKLCEYHLNRQITTALSGKLGLKRRVKSKLSEYDIDGVLSVLWDGAKRCVDRKEFKRISNLYNYIESNRSGICDVSLFADGEVGVVIESLGASENTVDNGVGDRFKKHGYSWGEVGAVSLLKVKELLMNGIFERWWSEDRDKVVEVPEECVTPLSASEMNKSKGEGMMEEIPLPCFQGPDQQKPWVKALKGLIEIKDL
jgi:hypothetical protein